MAPQGRSLPFMLTGWVAEEPSNLCGAFSRTQSSRDPDLLGGHILLSYCEYCDKQKAGESDRHSRLKDQGHQEDALCSTPPDLQASRVFAAAPCSHQRRLLAAPALVLFQRLRKACTWWTFSIQWRGVCGHCHGGEYIHLLLIEKKMVGP